MRINNFREVNSRSIGGDDVFLKMSCCGCSACLQKCPKKCIEMHEDAEGFLYPPPAMEIILSGGNHYDTVRRTHRPGPH